MSGMLMINPLQHSYIPQGIGSFLSLITIQSCEDQEYWHHLPGILLEIQNLGLDPRPY